MKKVFPLLFVLGVVFLSCSGGKELPVEKTPPLNVQNPYWMNVFPGQEDAPKSMVVIFPIEKPLEDYFIIDSVYFKGYHEALKRSILEDKFVYRAQIFKEENKVPVQPPFEIKEDEALISYLDPDNVRGYFFVRNIIQAESIYMP